MHLFLTDRLSCPRCGPDFGLILLADEVRDRRIISGDLGCANCREKYPVAEGFGDLRPPPRAPLSPPEPSSPPADPEETVRFGALLGVTEGPGTLLLEGPAVRQAGALADLIQGVEVVGVDTSLMGEAEREGVSRMVAHPRIPFFNASLRGVLLSGEVGILEVEEAARVVALQGRVVVLESPPQARERLEGLGLKVILEQEGVLVAFRERWEAVPLVPLRGS